MALSTLTLSWKYHHHPFQNNFHLSKLKRHADQTVIPHIPAPTTSPTPWQPQFYFCVYDFDLGFLTCLCSGVSSLRPKPSGDSPTILPTLSLDTGPCLLHPRCLTPLSLSAPPHISWYDIRYWPVLPCWVFLLYLFLTSPPSSGSLVSTLQLDRDDPPRTPPVFSVLNPLLCRVPPLLVRHGACLWVTANAVVFTSHSSLLKIAPLKI